MKEHIKNRINLNRMNNEDSASMSTSETIVHCFRSISFFTTIASSIAILGYLIGWNILSAYYNEIGAEWYRQSIPPYSILMASGKFCAMLLISAVAGTAIHIFVRKTEILNILWAIAFIVSICLHFARKLNISNDASVYVNALSILFSIVSLILMIAYFLATLSDQKLKWGPVQVYLASLMYIFIIYPLAIQFASFKATVDMNPASSTLSYAQKKGCLECKWRVVSITNGNALLAKLSKDRSARKFAIINLDDKWEINLDLPNLENF